MKAESAEHSGQSFVDSARDTLFHLVDRAPFGVYLVDARLRVAQVNRGALKFFRGVRSLIGRDFDEVIRILWPEPFATHVLERFRHTLLTGEAYHEPEMTELRADIAVVESYDWMIERVTMPDGSHGVVCWFHDLTERRKAVQDARFLSRITEQIRTATDADLLIPEVVRALGNYLGVNRCYIAQVEEGNDRWWVSGEFHADCASLAGTYRLSDYPASILEDLRAGRNRVSNDASADPQSESVYDTAFLPIGARAYVVIPLARGGRWLGSLVVATPRVRQWEDREVRLIESVAERLWSAVEKLRLLVRLQESEQVFRTLGEAVPDLLWMADVDGTPIYQNPAWHTYTGLSQDDLSHGGWEQMPHPDDLPRLAAVWETAISAGSPFELEFRCRRFDGTYRWFLARTVPVKDERGVVRRWVGMSTDIDDIRRSAEAQRIANRNKSQFLTTLSHELRDPLAPIRLSTYVLRQHLAGNEQGMASLDIIDRQVRQMKRLVDDLLDASRIARGQVTLEASELDLSALVFEFGHDMQGEFERREIRLSIHVPPDNLSIRGDAIRLTQVLRNLLTNAAKFTPPSGHVTVTLKGEAGEAVLTVSDTGLGVSPEDLERIFDMFAQVDTSLERGHSGLGVGLSLVRTIVELHGGTVRAESDGLERGTRFIVRLPLLEQ